MHDHEILYIHLSPYGHVLRANGYKLGYIPLYVFHTI